MTATPLRQRARWALLAMPALLLAWSAAAIVHTYSPTPFNDQWANVGWWRDMANGAPLWKWLVSQHNEHRLVFPRLVFLADYEWARGTNVVNLAAIGLIQLLGAALFVRLAPPQRLGWLGVLGLSTALSLIVLLVQWENFFWGFQVQFVGVFMLAAWAIYLFMAATRDPGAIRWPAMASALGLLGVATFTLASGLFVGVTMVVAGLLLRRGWPAVGLAAAATALLAALYLHGYRPVTDHSSPAYVLHHLGDYVRYVVTYLGNVWARGQAAPGLILGGLGVAATLAMLVVVFRERQRDVRDATLLTLVLFIGLTAAITAAGRLELGVGQAMASRYQTPVAYFWAAHALFWALRTEAGGGPALRWSVGLVLVAAYVAFLPLQRSATRELFYTRDPILYGSAALAGGVDDYQALGGIYANLKSVEELKGFLRQYRLAIFADDPGYQAGGRFAPQIVMPGKDTCGGAFDTVIPSPQQENVAKVFGWGYDLAAQRAFRRIVIINDANRIVGVAFGGLQRPDVRKAMQHLNAGYAGWVGSIVRTDLDKVTAYGVMRDGRACLLGQQVWPR